ncbi:MAG: FtsQ-type POTRA domain-containing protein [Firmicutes bacterium]|nr:FtsQ-type POTRA domain-containing protein [Bacillota bacterium]
METPPHKYSFGRRELVVQHKAKKIFKNKLGFIFLLIIANLSLILFLRSPYFTIGEISIQGTDKLDSGEVRLAMGVKEGMNIWKISPPVLRERILALPRVAGADVERVLPNKLRISVQEKKYLALVPYHSYYLELASDGTFTGIRYNYDGELPLINGLPQGQLEVGTKVVDPERGEIITIFLGALQNRPALPLAEINVEDPGKIIVYTNEGMEVWLGGKTDLAKKIEVFQHIHSHYFPLEDSINAGYLDLRVAEAPVYKPF